MTKVILVVDDDPNVLKMYCDLLKVSGYSTIEATEGEKGVELAKTRKPDLILMDILMPKMDGYAACSAIKSDKATKNIPVLMLTSLNHTLNRKLAKSFQADEYITKSLPHKELLKVIRRFL